MLGIRSGRQRFVPSPDLSLVDGRLFIRSEWSLPSLTPNGASLKLNAAGQKPWFVTRLGSGTGRAWNRASEGVCVTSVSITVETRPCSGCGTELSAPALVTPTPTGESWWCEACVRRTLQAIEESRQAPEDEA